MLKRFSSFPLLTPFFSISFFSSFVIIFLFRLYVDFFSSYNATIPPLSGKRSFLVFPSSLFFHFSYPPFLYFLHYAAFASVSKFCRTAVSLSFISFPFSNIFLSSLLLILSVFLYSFDLQFFLSVLNQFPYTTIYFSLISVSYFTFYFFLLSLFL